MTQLTVYQKSSFRSDKVRLILLKLLTLTVVGIDTLRTSYSTPVFKPKISKILSKTYIYPLTIYNCNIIIKTHVKWGISKPI